MRKLYSQPENTHMHTHMHKHTQSHDSLTLSKKPSVFILVLFEQYRQKQFALPQLLFICLFIYWLSTEGGL